MGLLRRGLVASFLVLGALLFLFKFYEKVDVEMLNLSSVKQSAMIRESSAQTFSSADQSKPSLWPTTLAPTLLPSTASPTAPTMMSAEDLELLKIAEKYRGFKYLIFQVDNRLQDFFFPSSPAASKNPKYFPKSFSEEYPAVSVLAISTWAREKGYGHIFFSGPRYQNGPYGNQFLGSVWNKLPASLQVFKIAKMAGIEYVIFLDSDISPNSGANYNLEDLVKSIQLELSTVEKPKFSDVHFVLTHDDKYWADEVELVGVYGERSGTINSGAYLFRTTPEAYDILSRFWWKSTQEYTPYEIKHFPVAISIQVDLTPRKQNNGNVSVDWAKVIEKSSVLDGYPNYQAKIIYENHTLNQGSNPQLVLNITLTFLKASIYFANAVRGCCKGSLCRSLIQEEYSKIGVDAKTTTLRCEPMLEFDEKKYGKKFDTFWSWPTEQDRLNFMYWRGDKYFYRQKTDREVLIAQCTRELGTRNPRLVFVHWCEGWQLKHDLGVLYSGILKEKYSQILPVDQKFKNQTEWDHGEFGGWGILNRSVTATRVIFPSK